MARIYLDYNASTPIDAAVAAAMWPLIEEDFGNPSSGHWAASGAKAALERARGQVAVLLGAENDEIVFSSGGREANNLALKKGWPGRRGARVTTSSPVLSSIRRSSGPAGSWSRPCIGLPVKASRH